MRGTAPLLATLLSVLFLREWPTPQVALGIVLICAGIVGIAFVGRNPHPRGRACCSRSRTPRSSPSTRWSTAPARAPRATAASYAVWLTFLEAVPFLCWIRWQRGREAVALHLARLAARPPRRRREPRRVRDRALGDDAGAYRRGRRAARNFGAVRCAHRRDLAEGRLRLAAAGGRGERGGRRGGAETVTFQAAHSGSRRRGRRRHRRRFHGIPPREARREGRRAARAGQAHLRHDVARRGAGRPDARDAQRDADEPLRNRPLRVAREGDRARHRLEAVRQPERREGRPSASSR